MQIRQFPEFYQSHSFGSGWFVKQIRKASSIWILFAAVIMALLQIGTPIVISGEWVGWFWLNV